MDRQESTGLDPIPDAPFNPWNFRPDVAGELSGARLTGYRVEAIDGTVGKVADASLSPDGSYLVVAMGWWVFSTRIQLPAGTVNHVDHQDNTVYVDRTRTQIKAAPQVAAEAYDDPTQRDRLASYYRGTYE